MSGLVIESTPKGERDSREVEQRTHELRTRMKAVNLSSHSLKQDKDFLELIQTTERTYPPRMRKSLMLR